MKCALWYWSHGSIFYELHDDEAAAASHAVAMVDYETGAPAGVQYEDGTYTDVKEWAEYKAEDDRQWQRMVDRARAERLDPNPKPVLREVAVPWDSTRKIKVEADAPAWVGAQPADAADTRSANNDRDA